MREVRWKMKKTTRYFAVEFSIRWSFKRKVSSEENVKNDSKSPGVCLRAWIISLHDYFWSHVAGSSAENLQILLTAAGESEVDDFHIFAIIEHEVLKFHISFVQETYRWATCLEWQYARASTICLNSLLASDSLSLRPGFVFKYWCSVGPDMKSVIIWTCLVLSMASLSFTIWSCFNFDKILISLWTLFFRYGSTSLNLS